MTYFMNVKNVGFIFKFILLHHKSRNTKFDCCFKLSTFTSWYLLSTFTSWYLLFPLLRHDICYKFFSLPSLRQTFIQRSWVTQVTQVTAKWFFWQSYRLDELKNKLLTKWNLSQAFLIHITLYLYLWWSLYMWCRVSRLLYVFPKVSSLDEKLLGKIILVLSLWKSKKKFWSSET